MSKSSTDNPHLKTSRLAKVTGHVGMKPEDKTISNVPLQPLRIPIGWNVLWNDFYDLEPHFKSWDDNSYNFKEDMLLVANERYDIAINLGWYPSFRSTGTFILSVAYSTDWDNPMRRYRTRSKNRVVAKLEVWLRFYTDNGYTPNRKQVRRRLGYDAPSL